MKRSLNLVFLVNIAFAGAALAQQKYAAEINKWRSEHETELKKDSGWLTVVGLTWLKDGKNTIGTGDGFDVELTNNFKKGRFGEIDFHDGKAILTVVSGVDATGDDKPFTAGELTSDEKGKPTSIKTGTQTFYLIKREERFGIRLKDDNSDARRAFTHLNWYPIDPAFRVTAQFERYRAPKEVLIPNVLGGDFKMKSPGVVKFKLHGKQVTLETVEEDEGELFIIFRDQTSRTTTYGAGRFLYAVKPVGDQVVLDFNKAENPPCAFTSFATCPLPPQQNRLQIAVPAGEKRYGHHAEK